MSNLPAIKIDFSTVTAEHIAASAVTSALKADRKTSKLARAASTLATSYGVKAKDWYTRAANVDVLIKSGLSQRQAVALVTDANGGNRPAGFSATEVGRLALVADALSRETFAALIAGTDDAKHDAAADLVILSRSVKGTDETPAARLARVVDMASKESTAVDALAVIRRAAAQHASAESRVILAEAVPAQRAGALTPGGTPPVTPTPDGEGEGEGDAPADANGTGTRQTADDSLRGATALRLIATLQARIAEKGFTIDPVLASAFEALASDWENVANVADALADASA